MRLYRLHVGEVTTEIHDSRELRRLVARYFDGATLLQGLGIWQGSYEPAVVIEIIADANALQNIVHLAGDIRQTFAQISVLITWSDVHTLDVREDSLLPLGAEPKPAETLRTFDDIGKVVR